MKTLDSDTLSEATQYLKSHGFKEDFVAKDDGIHTLASKKRFNPQDFTVIESFRFEGMTNPADSSELLVIKPMMALRGPL